MTVRDIIMGSAGSSAGITYVDDVFSTSLYSGTGNLQNVPTTCDLSTGNSMIWIKRRNSNFNHMLTDTVQGVQYFTTSNNAGARQTIFNVINSLNSTGFVVGSDPNGNFNVAGGTYVSWAFKKAPKFFDIVTYTGNGSGQDIPHSLGVTPGMILVKRLDAFGNWSVWHRNASTLYLDSSGAVGTNIFPAVTSSSFTVSSISYLNANGASFIAYVFAHDTDPSGLIQCGTFTSDSLGRATVSLGWEPQFFMFKSVFAGDWIMLDTMRGWTLNTASDSVIWANYGDPESYTSYGNPTSRGIQVAEVGGSEQFIYMAIRRPNRPPTIGTQVYQGDAYSSNGFGDTRSFMFTPDMTISQNIRSSPNNVVLDRLRGWVLNNQQFLQLSSTAAQGVTSGKPDGSRRSNSLSFGDGGVGESRLIWAFKRAPGFFDLVRYTGGGPTTTLGINHNLGVAPELFIFKRLDTNGGTSNMGWTVVVPNGNLTFDFNGAGAGASRTDSVLSLSATSFTVGDHPSINSNGSAGIVYLFASLTGISKIGTYTGNGTSQTINCGFTTGARFVLVKRTDSVGNWHVWDTARGIVAANDPYLTPNNTTAEIAGTDSIDPDNSGFIVNEVTFTNINVNAATYLYLAIA